MITKQQHINNAGGRHIHRVRGLLINLEAHLARTAAATDLSWGDINELQALERELAYKEAQREGTHFRINEDAAIEEVLANVDPDGESYFAV